MAYFLPLLIFLACLVVLGLQDRCAFSSSRCVTSHVWFAIQGPKTGLVAADPPHCHFQPPCRSVLLQGRAQTCAEASSKAAAAGSSNGHAPADMMFRVKSCPARRPCFLDAYVCTHTSTHMHTRAHARAHTQHDAVAHTGLACLGSGEFVRAFSMASNGASKVLSSVLLFRASTSFDRTFVIPSCHVCNLVCIQPLGLTC